LYVQLNNALRSADRPKLKAEYFPYLRLLLSGLSAKRQEHGSKPRVVNRGVKRDLVGEFPDEHVRGETLIWWSLTSTTSDIGVLENPMFLGKSGSRTIFQILTTTSVDVAKFSAFKESERLLPPGTALLVTGILPRDSSGQTIISCEEDPDAPGLVA